MSIRIGHAAIAETGGINGQKGDQTGREVRVQDWYSHSWSFMAIHPNPDVREKHAKAIEAACANDNIGYSQADRNSLYTLAKSKGFDLARVGLCNCDCASLQHVASIASGSGASYGTNGWWTGIMESELSKLGYKIVKTAKYLASADYCVRGAIYVNTAHHTAAGLDNGPKAAEMLNAIGLTPAQPSEADRAIEALFEIAVINSPDYWKKVIREKKVRHLDTLLIKAAGKIKKKGTRKNSVMEAVQQLVADGIINTPDYWLEHYSDCPNLGALLCALAGGVK